MNVRGSSYFPWPVRAAGVFILLVIAAVKVLSSPLLAGVLIVLAVIILTTHYGVRVDLSNKTYKEYVWLLGWKKGETINFSRIEYLFVKSGKVSRGYNSQIKRASITNVEYNGYVKFSENEKIHLANALNKQRVVSKLAPLKHYLKTKLIDYTQETPAEI